MAYCSNCGKELVDGAKFCFECGAPISGTDATVTSERRTVYDGAIHKCPNCGETLESFVPNCPSCGYELRSVNVSGAIKEFETRYEQANSITKKIDLVKTFTIPNTTEDIQEFLILALSNVTPELYETKKTESKEIRLSIAWETKFEQAYQKGKILFPGQNQFDACYRIMQEKKSQIIKIKRHKGFSKTLVKIIGIGSGALLALAGVIYSATPNANDATYSIMISFGMLIVLGTIGFSRLEN